MKSLDPRVSRLPVIGQVGVISPKASLDQFGSFEVFVQPKAGKPFQHEGIVHAPNLELAYVLAKEAFTRRFTCISIYVAETQKVYVSPMTEGNQNAYDLLQDVESSGKTNSYEIFHLMKRGKQHVHAGTVTAGSIEEAMSVAKQTLNNKQVFNVWAIQQSDIRFTAQGDMDLWNTLPEKKFRDAADYKGGDKLKTFLENQKTAS